MFAADILHLADRYAEVESSVIGSILECRFSQIDMDCRDFSIVLVRRSESSYCATDSGVYGTDRCRVVLMPDGDVSRVGRPVADSKRAEVLLCVSSLWTCGLVQGVC